MNPSLQRLTALIPPPIDPVSPGTPDAWLAVEAELGATLPSDFKEYTAVYGAGQWSDFFGVTNPFYKWTHPQASESWKDWIKLRFEGFEEFQRKYPKDSAPFGLHPKPEGLLAFGYDDNGGTICWQTTGNPDKWRIVCLDGELSQEYDSFDMTLTEFLDALMREKISPKTFPEDFFPIKQPAFRPYTTQ